jgi:hypothetical protein
MQTLDETKRLGRQNYEIWGVIVRPTLPKRIQNQFCVIQGGTYHGQLFPSLNILSLSFGEMVPNLLVTGRHEQSLNLTD